MKKSIIFTVLFIFISGKAISAEALQKSQQKQVEIQQKSLEKQNIEKFDELERQIRGDFRLFLQELYNEREKSNKEANNIKKAMVEVLEDANALIDESRKEIKSMSYSENRNLLIASVFLWISITIFIIMNLIFANNLKKELYFLRNGLLRSEIKENMMNLSNQLNDLNEKLDLMNRS